VIRQPVPQNLEQAAADDETRGLNQHFHHSHIAI
jgi:hypothetical protein